MEDRERESASMQEERKGARLGSFVLRARDNGDGRSARAETERRAGRALSGAARPVTWWHPPLAQRHGHALEKDRAKTGGLLRARSTEKIAAAAAGFLRTREAVQSKAMRRPSIGWTARH